MRRTMPSVPGAVDTWTRSPSLRKCSSTPVRSIAGANLDAADDAVGAGCGGDLDAVGVGVLMLEDAGEVDRRRVAADADCVKRVCRRCGDNHHKAQRRYSKRKAPDPAQCQFLRVRPQRRSIIGR